ncbi:hypothetical protein WR25_27106 [Diploscapter pachys]|uniref:Uncharacterized protein n=1 Tax=Diploscapter pachys TaxID=2018661 RepID=A0A2A2M5C0_9BILA|nr:hypothetical protein WR25_27106 [Diploscapter pachys]
MMPLVTMRQNNRYWPGLKRSGSSITNMPCSGAPGNGRRNQGWPILRRLIGQSTPRRRVRRWACRAVRSALPNGCRSPSSTPAQPCSRPRISASQASTPSAPPLRQASSASAA